MKGGKLMRNNTPTGFQRQRIKRQTHQKQQENINKIPMAETRSEESTKKTH